MAIADVDKQDSDGWWMSLLYQDLKAEQPRYNLLEAYRRGRPPLPRHIPKSLKAATREMIRMAQVTLGDLIIQAMVERMGVAAIRTSATDDDNGDQVAMSVWNNAGCPVIEADVYRAMMSMSIGYVAAALDSKGKPVATFQDPREMITVPDPLNPAITRRAFRLYHDRFAGRDYAVLWRPGQKRVASRVVSNKTFKVGIDGVKRAIVTFDPTQFTMHPVRGTAAAENFDDPDMLSEEYDIDDVLITAFPNRDGAGEFEDHLGALDGVNHVVLQTIVIATFQAFKQRALELANDGKGDLPKFDAQGHEIDWNERLSADPGALWLLPVGAKIWESTAIDMNGVLQQIKDGIQRLLATTRTPFSMFSSDAQNQSAEGAQNAKEGLIFKVRDRSRICDPRWARVESHLLLLAGEDERADPSKIVIGWRPPNQYSLAEMAQADSQALSLPDEQKWTRIWNMTPDEVAVARTQQNAQALRDAVLAATAKTVSASPAAPAPAPATQPPPDQPVDDQPAAA